MIATSAAFSESSLFTYLWFEESSFSLGLDEFCSVGFYPLRKNTCSFLLLFIRQNKTALIYLYNFYIVQGGRVVFSLLS